jgi:hypothetical protein
MTIAEKQQGNYDASSNQLSNRKSHAYCSCVACITSTDSYPKIEKHVFATDILLFVKGPTLMILIRWLQAQQYRHVARSMTGCIMARIPARSMTRSRSAYENHTFHAIMLLI